jgi:hypothetical protein
VEKEQESIDIKGFLKYDKNAVHLKFGGNTFCTLLWTWEFCTLPMRLHTCLLVWRFVIERFAPLPSEYTSPAINLTSQETAYKNLNEELANYCSLYIISLKYPIH